MIKERKGKITDANEDIILLFREEDLVHSMIRHIKRTIHESIVDGKTIAIPAYLGLNLNKREWNMVFEQIRSIATAQDVTVIIYYDDSQVIRLKKEMLAEMHPIFNHLSSNWHGFPSKTKKENVIRWYEETFEN